MYMQIGYDEFWIPGNSYQIDYLKNNKHSKNIN